MSMYEIGTITGAAGARIIDGSGTQWANNLYGVSVGSVLMIYGAGTVDAYQITKVVSNTQVEVSRALAKAVSNVSYGIITSETASTAAFSNQLIETMDYYRRNVLAWQKIVTETGDVSITAPDGTTVTVPSMKGIGNELNTVKLDLDEKLDKELLGTAGAATLQTHVGDKVKDRVITVGGFGLGVAAKAKPFSWEENNSNFSWYYATNNADSYGGAGHEAKLSLYTNEGVNDFIATLYANRQGARVGLVMKQVLQSGKEVNMESWRAEFRTTLNTSVDGNGFIKQASPIVKLFHDGSCELNHESQGVTTERISEGVYKIIGSLGFNSDAGWGGPDGGIEVPLDRNKMPLIWVDYEVEASGDLIIKTYHRTNTSAPAFARNEKSGYSEGDPIDIPHDRCIDLRLQMPD